jgi:hypothetical protein
MLSAIKMPMLVVTGGSTALGLCYFLGKDDAKVANGTKKKTTQKEAKEKINNIRIISINTLDYVKKKVQTFPSIGK